METMIAEIAMRIKALREILEISPAEMAKQTDTSLEQYEAYERGESDVGFTFLYECAKVFGVDIVELLTGDTPRLSFYTVVRGGKGLPMRRRKGFTYQHLAYRLKDKLAEPFLVTAPYYEEEQTAPIALSRHVGQEFDYVISGTLKVQLDDYVEILNEGDSVYYDSSHKHGMIAIGGKPCVFLAFVMKDPGAETDQYQTEEQLDG